MYWPLVQSLLPVPKSLSGWRGAVKALVNIFSMSYSKVLKDRNLGLVSVLQRHFSHSIHILFCGDKGPNRYEAEGTEEEQQRSDSEPLNAVD